MSSQLDQLSKITVIVADTGEIDAIREHKPVDSTTNPSLVLKALNKLQKDEKKDDDEARKLTKIPVHYAKKKLPGGNQEALLPIALDRIGVEFGRRILEIIPGYVSTELDARLSFDVPASVKRAVSIIDMYEELGIQNARDRVLIKVASTWEGMLVAKELREKHNIKCNMTLIFSIWQAAAASQVAGAYLISPFVGRITDWYKKEKGVPGFDAFKDDPGVEFVRNVYAYYKLTNSSTIVMGASFRNKHQVLALSGCDRLTIGPNFLQELKSNNDPITHYLKPETAQGNYNKKLEVTEQMYRWGMCIDPMATEKLAEGIRKFANDIVTLENILAKEI